MENLPINIVLISITICLVVVSLIFLSAISIKNDRIMTKVINECVSDIKKIQAWSENVVARLLKESSRIDDLTDDFEYYLKVNVKGGMDAIKKRRKQRERELQRKASDKRGQITSPGDGHSTQSAQDQKA